MSSADYKLLEIKDFHQLFNLCYFPGHLTSSSRFITTTAYLPFSSDAKCSSHWTDTILERIPWKSRATRTTKPVIRASVDYGATPSMVDGFGSLLGCICPAPPQCNPVCDSDGVTYGNLQKLTFARSCRSSLQLPIFHTQCLLITPT